MSDNASNVGGAGAGDSEIPSDDELYGPGKLGPEFWDGTEGVLVEAGQARVRLALDREIVAYFKSRDGDYRDLMADVLREHVARATAEENAPPAQAAE